MQGQRRAKRKGEKLRASTSTSHPSTPPSLLLLLKNYVPDSLSLPLLPSPSVIEVISRVNLETGAVNAIPGSERVITPNGAIRFRDKIIFCSQGVGEDQPGGLATLDPVTGDVNYLVNNFFGRRFNSPNDIAILSPPSWSTGASTFTTASTESHALLGTSIFFTDPTYAYQQHFKPAVRSPFTLSFIYPATRR